MTLDQTLLEQLAALVIHLLLALWAGGHALLTARDPRTAWGWIAVCILFPLAGPGLYYLFGINRVESRARRFDLRGRAHRARQSAEAPTETPEVLAARLQIPPALTGILRTGAKVTQLPLTSGNTLTPLHNAEQAYPRMLAAIERAQHSIAMTTYIFETNRDGQAFIEALAGAQARGVQVRVLIDAVGQWYSVPLAAWKLQGRGVPVERFNRASLWPPAVHLNLRNHRKLLLIDGTVGFTGGMNIGSRHRISGPGRGHRVRDVHFEVRGPVLTQLQAVFAEDWRFVAGEEWPQPEVQCETDGHSACRVIADGPNEDLDHLALVILSAINAATHEVLIVTPYFLPEYALFRALQSAALRGVDVTVLLPGKSNVKPVHWATRNLLQPLIEAGVQIYYQPPPFCHSKLLLIDRHYALIGSANLDPRSLRLNFELGVEVYGGAFAQTLADHIIECRMKSRRVTAAELRRRRLPARLRDALCWLFLPYL